MHTTRRTAVNIQKAIGLSRLESVHKPKYNKQIH